MQTWKPSDAEKLTILGKCDVFKGVNQTGLKALSAIAVLQQEEAGETLFIQGAKATGFYVLIAGTLHVYRTGIDGRQQILHIFSEPGDVCGEVPVFEGSTYPAGADTITPAKLLYLPRSDFLSLTRKHPEILLGMLAELSKRLRRFVGLIDDLSLKDVFARLAKHLLAESNGSDCFDLSSTKTSLAAQLGTIPETISRILRRMQQDGIITVDGRKIRILDREALNSI
jgi:CRP-like cAMP-binding protein